MPAFSYRYKGQFRRWDGSEASLHPQQAALLIGGPEIRVMIGISERLGKLYATSGLEVPSPKVGLALLDTGASHSCIDNDLAKGLKLPVIDTITMTTPAHAG